MHEPPALQELMEPNLGNVTAEVQVVFPLAPAKVVQESAERCVPSLGIETKNGLEVGCCHTREKVAGEHGANADISKICLSDRVKSSILVREESHESRLETEPQFVALRRSDVPAPGRRVLIAVGDLTAQELVERGHGHEGIEIVQEVGRGVEMRIMVNQSELMSLRRIPVKPDVGEVSRGSPRLVERRVVEPWRKLCLGRNARTAPCGLYIRENRADRRISYERQAVACGELGEIDRARGSPIVPRAGGGAGGPRIRIVARERVLSVHGDPVSKDSVSRVLGQDFTREGSRLRIGIVVHVAEEKQLVFQDWTADFESILIQALFLAR